jgi:hypothetical protein
MKLKKGKAPIFPFDIIIHFEMKKALPVLFLMFLASSQISGAQPVFCVSPATMPLSQGFNFVG